MESLLHRKIFRVNPVLGYLHMSLALGWFLLIVLGNTESRFQNVFSFNLPYFPIFFKYFVHERPITVFSNGFTFLMDFLLLFILSGVFLAIMKRFFSRFYGVKKTAKKKRIDRLALTFLWLIFPSRLIAESLTSATYQSGGFLTGNLGILFDKILPGYDFSYPAWWAYSIVLGGFFVTLPFSRYMHIPTEVLLIALRNFNINPERKITSFAEVETYACPSCGICIDKCQLISSAGINNTQAIYFLRSIRDRKVKLETAYNCMLCGRCEYFCPVGIRQNDIRLSRRIKLSNDPFADYSYVKLPVAPKADVIYFAGCMTHLTPNIKRSMVKILQTAGINYLFMDENATVCCGRPMLVTGKEEDAKKMINLNKKQILESGAKTLVTSCPICYKMFREEYKLEIEVLHHSQYILRLAEEKKIHLGETNQRVVYHDPCELGRGSKVYEAPRSLLSKTVKVIKIENEKEKALCCGGSIGILEIKSEQRDKITLDTIKTLSVNKPDKIVTSCPLCKKTLTNGAEIPVEDIAEIVAHALKLEAVTV